MSVTGEEIVKVDFSNIGEYQIYLNQLAMQMETVIYGMQYAADRYVEYYDNLGVDEQGNLVYDEEAVDNVLTNFENTDFDMYMTMTIPNGIIINTGKTEELVTYKNFDNIIRNIKDLNELVIYSDDDLKELAKFNASEEGDKQLAIMSLEAVRNDYPQYVELDNEELIQEILKDSNNGINTKIRESYDIKDYIDEIKYHAIGFNIGIKDSHTEMADIGPYDPNWQTLIWEALW